MIVKDFSALCPVARLPALTKVITPYIMSERLLTQLTELCLHVNSFSPIMQSKLVEDVTGALSDWNEVDSEAYGSISGRERVPCYTKYALLDILHQAIGNN